MASEYERMLLGQYGAEVVTGTVSSKSYGALQVIGGAATFATTGGSDMPSLSSMTHAEGVTIIGHCTGLVVTDGTVLAYLAPDNW